MKIDQSSGTGPDVPKSAKKRQKSSKIVKNRHFWPKSCAPVFGPQKPAIWRQIDFQNPIETRITQNPACSNDRILRAAPLGPFLVKIQKKPLFWTPFLALF